MTSLGRPSRAWMFATLSNERDRPSLSLPRAQTITDVMEAFGWIGSRQSPIHARESAPTVLQPGVLANSVLVTWISRASIRNELAQVAIDAQSPEELVTTIFLRFLSRKPTADELANYAPLVAEGFAQRVLPPQERSLPPTPQRLGYVSWSNHLAPEANSIQMERERQAREGDPADPRLRSSWRESYEDIVWSLINHPEFVWLP